ncbi:hypothetical protein [Paracoccus sp. IB05]|uniref:DUF6925 family protein n=1 Tax=Paracoccus sp. IB05 TaxID=2779367 RepID=UPI0018E71047|nr:hypothetical protein [Paracoccus sp. IB05]MBJ2151513.1 hypothetical protein [Paracoccus sp. IB05]
MTDAPQDETFALLERLFGAEGHLWSIGTLAGFMGFDLTGIPQKIGGALVLEGETGRARLAPGAKLLAFETLSSEPRGWNHGIALCQAGGPPPRPRDRRLTVVADDAALVTADQGAPALDLGLGHAGLRCLFRPAATTRAQALLLAGQHWNDCREALAALPGDWIAETPFLRAERVADGACPIHAIPSAGSRGLTHAATTPVPEGWLPFAHIFPPHPARVRPGQLRPFDPDLHAAFQTILARHGRPDLTALKAATRARLQNHLPPEATDAPGQRPDRHAQAVIRVTLRQWLAETGLAPPEAWLSRYDRPLLAAVRGQI